MIRPASLPNTSRIQHIIDDPNNKGKFFLHQVC